MAIIQINMLLTQFEDTAKLSTARREMENIRCCFNLTARATDRFLQTLPGQPVSPRRQGQLLHYGAQGGLPKVQRPKVSFDLTQDHSEVMRCTYMATGARFLQVIEVMVIVLRL